MKKRDRTKKTNLWEGLVFSFKLACVLIVLINGFHWVNDQAVRHYKEYKGPDLIDLVA